MDWQKVPPGELYFEGGDPYFQLRTGPPIPRGIASPDRFISRHRFLDAVLTVAGGSSEAGWRKLEQALSGAELDLTHLELIVSWASTLTPPVTALTTAQLLHEKVLKLPIAKMAAAVRARGLITAERWGEALEVARASGSKELEARALLGQGRARDVVNGDYPTLRRAEAALLRYDLKTAEVLLEIEENSQEAYLLRARSAMLREACDEAASLLSASTSGGDYVFGGAGILALARLLIDMDRPEEALSALRGILPDAPVPLSQRAHILRIVAQFCGGNKAETLQGIREETRSSSLLPPSVLVDIELARLEIGESNDLQGLSHALARVDTIGARRLALLGLTRVLTWPLSLPSPTSLLDLVVQVADVGASEPVLVLGSAELLRVAGRTQAAEQLLLELENAAESWLQDGSGLRAAIQSGLRRFKASHGSRQAKYENNAPSADLSSNFVRLSGKVVNENLVLSDGPYALERDPRRFCEELGLVLGSGGDVWFGPASRAIHLVIDDEDAAALPWELASRDGVSLFKLVTPVRSGERDLNSSASVHPVDASEVCVDVSVERKDRGITMEHLLAAYGETNARVTPLPGPNAMRQFSLFHFVAEVTRRRAGGSLRIRDKDWQPRELASLFERGRPQLLVLDLALSASDLAAAEQLLLANRYCWNLVRAIPELAILCGVFAASQNRLPYAYEIVHCLAEGRSLLDLAEALHRFDPNLPRGGHPLRGAIALSAQTLQQQFHLSG